MVEDSVMDILLYDQITLATTYVHNLSAVSGVHVIIEG